MFDIDKEYSNLKTAIARAYGVGIDANGNGEIYQVNRISLDSLKLIDDLENIFNNANLYNIADGAFNKDLVTLCYEKSVDVGTLYHRIAMVYGIGRCRDYADAKLLELVNDVRDYIDTLRECISSQYSVDLFSDKEELKWFEGANSDELIIYLLNIYLALFIKQIHSEIFGSRKDQLISMDQSNTKK